MKILKIKNGKAIQIFYEEGLDTKTVTSKEKAAQGYYNAFSGLALDIKTNLAMELGYQGKTIEEFIKKHRLGITAISFTYKEGETYPNTYEVWGDHEIGGTIWDTPIQLHFTFGNKESPDKSALRILEEAEKYLGNKRAQMNLFETPEESKDWKVTKVE